MNTQQERQQALASVRHHESRAQAPDLPEHVRSYHVKRAQEFRQLLHGLPRVTDDNHNVITGTGSLQLGGKGSRTGSRARKWLK